MNGRTGYLYLRPVGKRPVKAAKLDLQNILPLIGMQYAVFLHTNTLRLLLNVHALSAWRLPGCPPLIECEAAFYRGRFAPYGVLYIC